MNGRSQHLWALQEEMSADSRQQVAGMLATTHASMAQELSASHSNSVQETVTWDGSNDPRDPFNWPLRKKWFAIGLGLFASFVSSVNGTILSVAYQQINGAFGISDAHFPNSYLPTTSWGIGGAIFSFVLFPLLEDFGVRPVVLGTYFVMICFLIPIGPAQNFATLIVSRFFTGGCVQLLSNAVAGIISNVFDNDRARSIPISLYVTTYLVATSIGAVIGSAILQYLSWRWIGYIELIWTCAFFLIFVFWLPESRGAIILKAKAKRLRRQGHRAYTKEELQHTAWLMVLVRSLGRPIRMLCTEPVVVVAALWAAFSLGTIYLFTQSVQQVFGSLYFWSAIQAGYVQTAIVVGELLGCGLCWISNTWYDASASRNTEVPGTPIPEARLYASMIGGSLGVTGGMLLYGWTSYYLLPWIAPTLGLTLVGFGTTAIIVSNANYVIDAYSMYAASALGAVGLVENMCIAFLPLASPSMYTNLGFHWASSLLAFISLALVATPFAVLRWGKEIRSSSPFMKEAVIDRQRNAHTMEEVCRQA